MRSRQGRKKVILVLPLYYVVLIGSWTLIYSIHAGNFKYQYFDMVKDILILV